ncbi:MAG: RluA family pseudouridine synthase [Rhodospirillales bacterium]|nr:RluA family pseudouridine synthase [Rhodospirillales bacterium]MCW8952242.1 RluA family pseudouridine synthase [Rhodospirillales bacterium]
MMKGSHDNNSGGSVLTLKVEEGATGGRFDKLLADMLPEFSRSRIKALILEGQATIDGTTITDPSYRVKPVQAITLTIPESRPADPEPQDIALDILYEDEHLIVINKPAGLVVHPAPGSPDQTLVNALLSHCHGKLSGIGGVKRPGIVHRLDKDTSGVMVVAKDDATHQGLSRQFEERTVDRAYFAVVWGVPKPMQGEVEGNIGRSPRDRKKMTVLTKGGKPALTRYKVVNVLGKRASLVECRLATGRTHQIRVHMAHIGHSIVGDPVYGGADSRRLKDAGEALKNAVSGLGGQALHAHLLGFIHPVTLKALSFDTKIPNEINEIIERFNLE